MGVSPWALDNSAQTYGQELYVCNVHQGDSCKKNDW